MSTISTQEDFADTAGQLSVRCRTLGVPLLRVSTNGTIEHVSTDSQWWLHRLVIESRLFANALSQRAKVWTNQSDHEAEPLWPGCWVVPIPVIKRRRPVAFHVAVFLSDELPDSDQLHQLCDAADLDYQATLERCGKRSWYNDAVVERFGAMLAWMSQDVDDHQRQTDELNLLSQQLGETYEELSLVYRVSAQMTVTQDPATFMAESCDELQQVVGLKWAAIHLMETDERLQDLRGKLFATGKARPDDVKLASVGRILLSRLAASGDSMIVDNVASLGIKMLNDVADRLLIVPLTRDHKTLGVLFGADKLDGSDISSVDSKLVTSLAQNIGIFLANAMLYNDQQDMFMGTLRALVSAIDAKDTYTFGHSERVAWVSRCLARGAGLDEHTCERVYLSGLVHDVGKIGVPEAVLTKPGKLTDDEFEMIKTHPRIGGRILQDIRQMHDLLPGVLFHHERYDGDGYPDGLAGDAIPLFGRLICLADSFDAMSSDRTYRESLPTDHVVQEIERCSGTQFDPHLARVFTSLDLSEFYQMLQAHRDRTSPLRQEMGASA